jgi:hypothetical protein
MGACPPLRSGLSGDAAVRHVRGGVLPEEDWQKGGDCMSSKKIISKAEWLREEQDCYAYTNSDGRFIEETKDNGLDGLTPVLILEDVKEIYDSLNESERFGIRFGLFPMRIQEPMQRLHISAPDLMQYDEEVRQGSKS